MSILTWALKCFLQVISCILHHKCLGNIFLENNHPQHIKCFSKEQPTEASDLSVSSSQINVTNRVQTGHIIQLELRHPQVQLMQVSTHRQSEPPAAQLRFTNPSNLTPISSSCNSGGVLGAPASGSTHTQDEKRPKTISEKQYARGLRVPDRQTIVWWAENQSACLWEQFESWKGAQMLNHCRKHVFLNNLSLGELYLFEHTCYFWTTFLFLHTCLVQP